MTELPSPITIDGRVVGPGAPCWIIAEIGINHEGSAEICARMIEAAAAAGADAMKLQTIDADENYMRGTPSHDLFSRCALTREETARMFDLSRSLGVAPFTTAGDFATLEWVERLNPAAHKISSGLMTHLPLIRQAAATGRPMLMSTGMASPDEIDISIACARDGGASAGQLAIFHCVSLYPAPPETVNLAAIRGLEGRYGLPVGWSDHVLGNDASVLAVAAGACMIEKHFTLDSRRASYDHSISLEPAGLADLVNRVRAAEAMLGSADRPMTAEERAKAARMHRIVVARRPIAAGETLTRDNVGLKRPLEGVTGLPPGRFDQVLGRVAPCDLGPDQPVPSAVLEDA